MAKNGRGKCRFRVLLGGLTCLFLAASPVPGAADPRSAISNVAVSLPFFNPTLGQTLTVSFDLFRPGSVSVFLLDRDGYLVRKLAVGKVFEEGGVRLAWDGRDDAGRVVPDEAYSLKIDYEGKAGRETYFPGNAPPEDLEVAANYYDRRGGVLSYVLARPARVHIQAGTARRDPKTHAVSGPVLKTLVNREPRPAGPIVENWNGFDEGQTFQVASLRDFALAIAATSLPENSILTSGNRDTPFVERAGNREGKSQFTFSAASHRHHRGLNALEDAAPSLRLEPRNASWSAAERVWSRSGKGVELTASLGGPTAPAFRAQPGRLVVFVDSTNVMTLTAPPTSPAVRIPIREVPLGTHRITVNWVSEYGPVAVNSVLLRRGKSVVALAAR